jgi:hypothetical protein
MIQFTFRNIPAARLSFRVTADFQRIQCEQAASTAAKQIDFSRDCSSNILISFEKYCSVVTPPIARRTKIVSRLQRVSKLTRRSNRSRP